MRNTEVSPLGSVDKALQLIVLLRSEQALSVKDAATSLDVAPSTAHRLLSALAHRGFAAQDSQRRYRPGPTLGEVMVEPLSLSRLREVAREPLNVLHEAVGETVQLMILRGGNIQFVDGLEGRLTLRVAVRIGDLMPAFCSAGGKAILAELNPADLEQLYRQGLPPWPTSRFRTVADLKRHLAEARRAGFGTNFEETERGVVGLGVAVHSAAGAPVAAVTVALPSARFGKEQLEEFLPMLRACRENIEDRLHTARTAD
ncbi:IclR family transcriptional regulator [Georgenia sp. EYE_87]|uniref:IclR family transcriptional regulator n=1 Tax=Georgenia sp. EYE_87 TaxID=2853448 RepID=UPI002002DAE4|nr:IclR family transcriptional regulator [Georgenia sp. EYE_87]MCK6211441.1 IclR family transcriptional regulator [Georgenia sp. EYE_87]